MSTHRLLLAIALSASAGLSAPHAQEGENRPKFSFLQQNEDWSQFSGGPGMFDGIKHMPLNDSGSTWLSIGGRVEARAEVWENFGFAPQNDDTFVVSRALLHTDFHFGESVRLYVEGKTAQATDRDLPGGRRALDMDTLALQQLFLDVSTDVGDSADATFRVGRQALLFGKQRLISPLPWGNTLRTWEGVTAVLSCGAWKATGLFTAFVPVDKTDFNERDDDEILSGIYATRADGPSGVDVYALFHSREAAAVNGTAGGSERITAGTRHWGKLDGGLDWEAEAAYQFGEVGAGDVSAGFAAAELGWRWDDSAASPRAWIGADWASGDESPGGDIQTFDSLYPLGHAYFGFIDAIGRQNIASLNTGVSHKPLDALSMRYALHSFWLDDRDDAIYNAGGGVLRAPGAFDSNDVGLELDVTAGYSVSRHTQLQAGYSYFQPGGAIEDSGPDEDIHFVYFGAKFTF